MRFTFPARPPDLDFLWTETPSLCSTLRSRIRRIACEGGEWFCSLSQQPHLPLALDETADGTHDDLPLAVLRALVEALRINAAQRDTPAHVPLIGPTSAIPVCCDNFI
jgi:hypothetical protein